MPTDRESVAGSACGVDEFYCRVLDFASAVVETKRLVVSSAATISTWTMRRSNTTKQRYRLTESRG